MIENEREYFKDFEIVHNFTTYYANGYVEYNIEKGVGGNYEGYDFETVYHIEICDIHLYKLLYYNEKNDCMVDIMGKSGYSNIEEIAKDAIWYEFE